MTEKDMHRLHRWLFMPRNKKDAIRLRYAEWGLRRLRQGHSKPCYQEYREEKLALERI